MSAAGKRLLRFWCVLSVGLLCAPPALSEQAWTDAELKAPGAAASLLAAVAAEPSPSAAISLLDRYAALLADDDGRGRAFTALAQLREMTGSFSLAADAWSSAAAALKGGQSHIAELNSIRCLIAVNETDRALSSLDALMKTELDQRAAAQAVLLKAYAHAFSREAAAEPLLRSLLDYPSLAEDRPVVLFLLARLFGDQDARKRLVGEYASSLENRLLNGDAALSAAPHWLLAAERTAIAISEKPIAEHADESSSVEKGPVSLQVGLFKSEKNAQLLADRLSAKGFKPTVAPRAVESSSYWAVTVDPESDADKTMMSLKNAGFESFPLF